MLILVVRKYPGGSTEPISIDSYVVGKVSNRLLHEHA
jgi:hypothetical protein